jgi:hypothetical protein
MRQVKNFILAVLTVLAIVALTFGVMAGGIGTSSFFAHAEEVEGELPSADAEEESPLEGEHEEEQEPTETPEEEEEPRIPTITDETDETDEIDVTAITDAMLSWLQEKYGSDYEEIYNALMEQYDSSIKDYIQSLVEEQRLTEEEAAGWETFAKTAIGIAAAIILLVAIVLTVLFKRKISEVITQFKTGINQLLVAENALAENGQATNAALKKILSVKGKEEVETLTKGDEALQKAQEEINRDV